MPQDPNLETYLSPEEAEIMREMDEETRSGKNPLETGPSNVIGEEEEGEGDQKTAEELAAAKAEEERLAAEKAAAAQAAAAQAAEKVEEAAAAHEAVAQQQEEDVQPQYVYTPIVVDAPENYDARMAAFQTQKAELDAKADRAEITMAEYRAAIEKINVEEFDLRAQKREYDSAERQNRAGAERMWVAQVNSYAAKHAELSNNAGRAAWNAELQALNADKANDDKSPAWFLKEAHARMRKAIGLPPVGAPAPAGKPPARKPPAAPGSLRDAGSAAPVDTGHSEFADINRLEGVAQEAALAKLQRTDPHAYDRWLSTGGAA